MSSKASLTLSLDRTLIDQAKVVAQQRNCSVSALVAVHLQYLVDTLQAGEQTGNTNYSTLLDFSLGRICEHDALTELRVTSVHDLFHLLKQVRLPKPQLSNTQTQQMVRLLHQLCEQEGNHGQS